MSEDYRTLVRDSVLDQEEFLRATFSGHRRGAVVPWLKVIVRPVIVKSERRLQFVYYDAQKSITGNHNGPAAAENLEQLLDIPFKNIHVAMKGGDLQINFSKKGKALIQRGKASQTEEAQSLAHNRRKRLPLPADTPDPYLEAVGIMTADGKVKADRQKKFKQINEFLKLIQQTGELEKFDKPFLNVVDYGCGNAYLTFAVYHYLNHKLGIRTHLVGVDSRPEPLEKHARTAQALGWDDLTFQAGSIIDFVPAAPPDITLALHACDTATDEALAQGIRWQSKLIFSVPCCHHHLQHQLGQQVTPEPFRPVLRHGIMGERLGDVLTDTLRALILRIMGYKTEVLQFVSAEHTAKNVMLRAVRTDAPATTQLIREYRQLKDYWNVTPYLETLLGESLTQRLD
jgi:SAM-dependent methyltransferase